MSCAGSSHKRSQTGHLEIEILNLELINGRCVANTKKVIEKIHPANRQEKRITLIRQA